MGSKSNFLENEILDHILSAATYTAPGTVYVALYTVTPSDTSTGSSGGTEVTGGSYARASVTNNATNWPAASGGSKSNGTAITFPTATADWGTVVAFAITTAATLGEILYWGAVSPSKVVSNGDTAQFAIGQLVVTED